MVMRLKIRELRKDRGWTIDQMAEMIGVSKSHLSEVETGKKNPSSPLMDTLAALFEVDVVKLYDAGPLADDLDLIEAELRQMSDDERKAVVRMVQAYRKP